MSADYTLPALLAGQIGSGFFVLASNWRTWLNEVMVPGLVTLLIGGVLMVWGIYALTADAIPSGVGVPLTLPFLKWITEKVIHMTEREGTPIAKLMALNKIALNMEHEIDCELRRWAASDAVVREAIEAIDKRRVDYVASLLMHTKNISSQQAIDLAVMNYASLIGLQQMFNRVSRERRTRIDHIYVDILNTLPDHN